MDAAEHKRREDELLKDARFGEQSHDPVVKYFASWLAFYIEQLREARAAWEASLERMGTP